MERFQIYIIIYIHTFDYLSVYRTILPYTPNKHSACMSEVNFQQIESIKIPLIKPIYKAFYPSAKPKKNEQIIVGYKQQQIICVVRFRPIERYSLLTGMLVIPAYRQQGIANQLLTFCQAHHLSENSFCFAYQHLESLYKSVGFRVIEVEQLPNSLQQLFIRYTGSGKKLLPMRYLPTVLT